MLDERTPPLCVITGVGLTVIVYVEEIPVQLPLMEGVTVTVETIAAFVGLRAVNAGTFPVPLAAKPIAVLEFVQA